MSCEDLLSVDLSWLIDVQSLALPIAGARLAGCVRADTRRVQRLLYLAPAQTPQAAQPPQERAYTSAAPQTGTLAHETDGRATGAEIGVSACPPPTPPDAGADLDALLAYEDFL